MLIIQLFRLHQLIIYQMIDEKNQQNPYIGYYWKNIEEPHGWGPFPTIQAAISHYEAGDLSPMETAELEQKIIQVNFKTKKRTHLRLV